MTHPLEAFLTGMSLAPNATLVHHREGSALNDRAVELLGSADRPVEGVVDGRLVVLDRSRTPWSIAAELGEDQSADLRVVDPRGVEHWVTAESRVTDLDDQRVVVTTMFDTTVRQQWARTVLDDLRTRFETGWHGSSIPVFLLSVEQGDRGRILYANGAMSDLVGADGDQLLGRRLCELLVDDCHRDSYDGGVDTLLGGEDAEQTMHVLLQRLDGAEPHPVMLGLTAMRSMSGRPVFIVGFAIDHEPLATAERAHHRDLLRVEAMYQRSADLVVFVSTDGTLELVGPSVETMLGFDRDALCGTDVRELVHPDDLDAAAAEFRRVAHAAGPGDDRRTESMRLRIRDARGAWHPVEVVPTRASGPDVDGLVVTVRDRAREEQLEREASALDERARQIVETAVDGIWVVDELGRTTFVNGSLATMLATTPDEMAGRTIHDFMDDDGRARAEVLTERRRAGIHESFDFRLIAADGRPVDTFVSTRPVLDGTGAYAGAVAWITDVTDRLAAAERLRASEARLRALLQAFPDMVVRMDRDGTYLEVYNAPDDATAASARSMIGRTVTEAYPDDTMPGVAAQCLADIDAALGGRVVTTEYHLPDEDGTASLEARFAPLGDGEVLSLVRDMTELRRAEAARNDYARELERRTAAAERLELERELERAGRLEAMGQLAGGVAHDVNNLLGVIGNYAAAITRTDDPDQVRVDAEEISHAVDRGAALTRQLLQVGRPGGAPSVVEDVHDVVDQLAATLRGSFPPDVELIVMPPSTDCSARIDRGRIEQAVLNLVVNAKDALRGTGRVVVTVERQQRGPRSDREVVVVCVADDGGGMPAAIRERAFEPFFTTKASGTGLGLAIVSAVAAEHGGVAEVTSSAEGTTVSIELTAAPRPTGRPGHDADPGVHGEESDAPRSSRIEVLVVDDDAHVRRATARLARELGFGVAEADGGATALELLASGTHVDVVVTDVRMPGMTGPQLATRIEQLHPGLPVVFVTGFADELLAERPADRDRMLTKPYDADALSRMLHSVQLTRV